jgi:hypothetical protein
MGNDGHEKPGRAGKPHEPVGLIAVIEVFVGKIPNGKGPGNQQGDNDPTQVDLDLKTHQLEYPQLFSKHGRLSIKVLMPVGPAAIIRIRKYKFFLYHVSGPLVKRRIKRQKKEGLIKIFEAFD